MGLSGNGRIFGKSIHANDCLPFFATFLLLCMANEVLKTLRYRTLAGGAMLVMSVLFILMAVGVPLIKPDFSGHSTYGQLATYIPRI